MQAQKTVREIAQMASLVDVGHLVMVVVVVVVVVA